MFGRGDVLSSGRPRSSYARATVYAVERQLLTRPPVAQLVDVSEHLLGSGGGRPSACHPTATLALLSSETCWRLLRALQGVPPPRVSAAALAHG